MGICATIRTAPQTRPRSRRAARAALHDVRFGGHLHIHWVIHTAQQAAALTAGNVIEVIWCGKQALRLGRSSQIGQMRGYWGCQASRFGPHIFARLKTLQETMISAYFACSILSGKKQRILNSQAALAR